MLNQNKGRDCFVTATYANIVGRFPLDDSVGHGLEVATYFFHGDEYKLSCSELPCRFPLFFVFLRMLSKKARDGFVTATYANITGRSLLYDRVGHGLDTAT